jgi:hypothetical protein
MAPVRHPLIDLVMNDETSRYVGHLERKILQFTLDDMKMRALLELLTGDMWDNNDFHKQSDTEIQQLAVDTLKRRLNMSEADARRLVADRWNRLNPPTESPEVATYLFGPKPNVMPHNVTVSRPLAVANSAPPYDVKKHLAGLQQAAENRAKNREGL